MTVTAGAPRARTLAGALRKAREATGKSVREFARVLGMSHATVSKWENTRLVPDVEQVVAYMQAAGVTGEARERVLQLVRGSDDPSWLASGLAGASQGLAGVLECERTATEIVQWAPLLVPGPCQTRDTAHAILRHDEALSPKELHALVDVRVGRRKILTDIRDEAAHLGPVEYTALISENALYEQPGGHQVAIEQLRHLLTVAELPTVSLHVVRARGEWHPGLSGPFILYHFADDDPIVHLEHHKSSAFLYDAGDITAYKVATTVIRRRAMTPAESTSFITNVLNELENSG
ncbi:MAG TPA: helix-turn-helix transcriptional regulator [Pseudonocardiaceae bacterium]|nr:helix-turn-helix transcriptional regulator [Pseudonocardiaceae bacterium]